VDISVTLEQHTVPVTIFRIRGDIDIASYQELEAKARDAFAQGTRNLVLDLSEVGYVSSAGLRAIHGVFRLLSNSPGDEASREVGRGIRDGTFKSPHLKLLNPSPFVQAVLKTTGFDMFLEIHRDLREAVASFSDGV
jgi:anti-anti-sigma factor